MITYSSTVDKTSPNNVSPQQQPAQSPSSNNQLQTNTNNNINTGNIMPNGPNSSASSIPYPDIIQSNESDIQNIVFAKISCSVYVSKMISRLKLKGTCLIKIDHLTFHPTNSSKAVININIYDIISFNQIKSFKIGEPSIVKIKTGSNSYFFTGWNSSIQQFFEAYLTKEQYHRVNLNMQNRTSLESITSNDMVANAPPPSPLLCPVHLNRSQPLGNTEASEGNQDHRSIDELSHADFDGGVEDAPLVHDRHYFAQRAYHEISNKLSIDFTRIVSEKFELSLHQVLNCFIGSNEFVQYWSKKTGSKSSEFTGWHIDINGFITGSVNYEERMKITRNVVTATKYFLVWPYIPNKLVVLKGLTTINNVPSVKQITGTVYFLLYHNEQSNATQLNVYANFLVKGMIITQIAIKKATLGAMVNRLTLLCKEMSQHLEMINQNDMMESHFPEDIPQKILVDPQTFSKRLHLFFTPNEYFEERSDYLDDVMNLNNSDSSIAKTESDPRDESNKFNPHQFLAKAKPSIMDLVELALSSSHLYTTVLLLLLLVLVLSYLRRFESRLHAILLELRELREKSIATRQINSDLN